MFSDLARAVRGALWSLAFVSLVISARAEEAAPPAGPMPYDADTTALRLARRYAAGGDDAAAALIEALQHMGWSVRDAKGATLYAPPAGTNTGLALREYELAVLLKRPSELPAIRLISFAQALAVPLAGMDPEELAQGFVDTIRKSAESTQPQQRFWARYIVALGQVAPDGFDLLGTAPPSAIPPSEKAMKKLAKEAQNNPFAMLAGMQPAPVWPEDDPVLAPSPKPKARPGDTRLSPAERDQKRMGELQEELKLAMETMRGADETRQQAIEQRVQKLSMEMAAISQRMQTAALQQAGAAMKKFAAMQKGEDVEDEEDDAKKSQDDDGPRFLAEWRDQPLSMLQIVLLTRVFAADLHLAAQRELGAAKVGAVRPAVPALPLAMLGSMEVAGPPTSFGDQIASAGGDIWATGWGKYTGDILEHNLPDNKFSVWSARINSVFAWLKAILSVALQKITLEVENDPLVRTKTRTAGEQRTVHAKVEIDFPKSDALKAIRAVGNLATLDLQVPDGGPVGGAKVVWRLPEGSYNTKYQTSKGGWEYKPELAVVQFAHAEGNKGYVSYTNDAGEATITIEGAPQRRNLPKTVRPYPRRAVVAVEVTIKVGNLTQDLNDAISTYLGGPVHGTLTFLADMVLRTSIFFQKGKVFEVTDWKEPAWEGEFNITVKGSGSKHEKGEKGGPDQDHEWSMYRYMEGKLHTPDWDEENEQEKSYQNDGKHVLEIDSDTRAFKLEDSSSSRTKNSHNRYEAMGPMQTRPPGQNQLELFSRAEPSGSATLTFNGGKMMLELQPFFGAQCIVGRSEQSRGRSWSKAGPEYLSLLGGVYPDTFNIIEDNDGTSDYVEGEKTFDCNGNLPYVPTFDVKVVVKYRLWKNGPPPKNKGVK